MVVLRTFWAAIVTLSLGQWVTLHPEEELLMVLTAQSWGAWGLAGEDFGYWGPGGGIDLSVTLLSLNGLPDVSVACSMAVSGDVLLQVWRSLLWPLLSPALRALPSSPEGAHSCTGCS